jgi:hypothetical protein
MRDRPGPDECCEIAGRGRAGHQELQVLAYYADETTWDEYPESDVPLRLLGDEVLMDATWAIVADDSLARSSPRSASDEPHDGVVTR